MSGSAGFRGSAGNGSADTSGSASISGSAGMDMRYDAVVLAGGSGRRLGGADKALLEVGGEPLLGRVLAAVAGAQQRVCVGPARPTDVTVTWCREDPSGGGPVAAIGAALPHLRSELVVVLAVDLPHVDARTVAALVVAVRSADGAVALDGDGRSQPLLAAYRSSALHAACARLGPLAGARARDLVATLDLRSVAVGAAAADCDTPDDLRAARARAQAYATTERGRS